MSSNSLSYRLLTQLVSLRSAVAFVTLITLTAIRISTKHRRILRSKQMQMTNLSTPTTLSDHLTNKFEKTCLLRHFLRWNLTPSPQLREHELQGPQALHLGYFLYLKLFETFAGWMVGFSSTGGERVPPASVGEIVDVDRVTVAIVVNSDTELLRDGTTWGDEVWLRNVRLPAILSVPFRLRKYRSLSQSLCF